MIREVEIIDGLQKREMGASGQSAQSGLLPMRDLFRHQQREEVPIGPRFPLGSLHEVAPHAAGVGQMEPLEEGIQIVGGRHHDRPPTRREPAAVLDRVQVLRGAPPLRAPSATWTRPPRGSSDAANVGGGSDGSKGKTGREASR